MARRTTTPCGPPIHTAPHHIVFFAFDLCSAMNTAVKVPIWARPVRGARDGNYPDSLVALEAAVLIRKASGLKRRKRHPGNRSHLKFTTATRGVSASPASTAGEGWCHCPFRSGRTKNLARIPPLTKLRNDASCSYRTRQGPLLREIDLLSKARGGVKKQNTVSSESHYGLMTWPLSSNIVAKSGMTLAL